MAAASSCRNAAARNASEPARSVVLSVAASLDGYIARLDGSVDWLIMDPAIDFAAFTRSVDVILVGRKTMDAFSGQGGGGSMGKIACYIFSRSKPPGRRDGVEYVNRPPAELVRELKAQRGKDIWLMGGGELAREFLREDVVDRVELAIIPILLGEGIPLFPPGFPQRDWALVNHRSYPSGILSVTYARASSKAPRSK